MKKIILTLVVFSTIKIFACSCSQFRLTNVISGIEFIGIVKFKSLKETSIHSEIYKAEFEIKEQFIGNKNAELFIESQEGSSCGFLPESGSEYFILAYKNENGLLATSFCLARNVPNNEILSILREVRESKIYYQTTRNLRQITKKKINSSLFEKNFKGAFIYEVNLNSNFKVTNLKPFNTRARKNFNENIKQDLTKSFEYMKMDENLKMKDEVFKTFIILSWSKNYEEELVFESTKF